MTTSIRRQSTDTLTRPQFLGGYPGDTLSLAYFWQGFGASKLLAHKWGMVKWSAIQPCHGAQATMRKDKEFPAWWCLKISKADQINNFLKATYRSGHIIQNLSKKKQEGKIKMYIFNFLFCPLISARSI